MGDIEAPLGRDDSLGVDADDGLLFDWLRHYAVLILLVACIGISGAVFYLANRSVRSEAWTLTLAQDTEDINSRQFDALADAIFQSRAVWLPATKQLGVANAREFLRDQVDLRPIADSPGLYVVGRSNTLKEASRISDIMTQSFVETFNESQEGPRLVVLGEPEPARIRGFISRPVLLILGAAVGLWLGICYATLHYRFKRPVLSLRRAARLAGASRVTVLDGKGFRRLGILRTTRAWKDNDVNRSRMAHLSPRDGSGESPQELGRQPQIVIGHSASNETDLSVAGSHPSTEGDLAEGEPRPIELIWIR